MVKYRDAEGLYVGTREAAYCALRAQLLMALHDAGATELCSQVTNCRATMRTLCAEPNHNLLAVHSASITELLRSQMRGGTSLLPAQPMVVVDLFFLPAWQRHQAQALPQHLTMTY